MAYERDQNSRVSASRRCAICCSILAAVPVTPLHLVARAGHAVSGPPRTSLPSGIALRLSVIPRRLLSQASERS